MKPVKTILLTGATGFLGSHLLSKLLKLNYSVIILKRSTSNTWRISHLLSKVISYDVDTIPLTLPFEKHKIDIIIHTVTNYGRTNETISSIVDTNLIFSLKLLETAILFNTDTFFNTDTLSYKYLNHYSLSKKQFVEWLKYFSNKIKIINFKLEHMYGPKDSETKFVEWLITQLKKNRKYINLTEGNQKRDFIYIDDVVSAYMLLLNKKDLQPSFSEWDVGTGNLVSVKTFVKEVYNQYCSTHLKNITKLNFGAVPYRAGELMTVTENIFPLKNMGWIPKYNYKSGIKKLLQQKK